MNPTHPGSRCVHSLKGCIVSLAFMAVLFLAGCGRVGIDSGNVPPGILSDRLIQPFQAYLIDKGEAAQGSRPSVSSGSYTLTIEPLEKASLEKYARLELDLATDLPVENPYEQDENDLRVQFTSPSGRMVQVGAFWYQGYDLQTRQPRGEPGWKVRFTPDEVGRWEATALAEVHGLQSPVVEFDVTPSSNPGYIGVHPYNPHYLAFDNGNFFFPIGLNMAWCRGCSDPVGQYRQWLDQFSASGGNTIRVWMAAWSFGIEWADTGLGNYDQRQYQAWELDQVFSLAEARGVKIILVLINHGPFSLVANSEWKHNPYNAALGGPLTSPEQFVTDPTAKSLFKRRLSYIVNRWGYSPDLLAWEWFNEVDHTPITDQALIPWLEEMTAYLRQLDVNHHLRTISYAMRNWSSVWQLPELDLIQRHEYAVQFQEQERDLAGRAVEDFQTLAMSLPEKPMLLGEFGYSAIDYGDNVERTGIHLHNGLWATTFSGYAGSGMYWWWDNYVASNNLWKHFKSLSNFIKDVDLSRYQAFTPMMLSSGEGTAEQVHAMGLRGDASMVWLRSNNYTASAAIAAQKDKGFTIQYVPPLIRGLILSLDGMDDGEYEVSWYDPQSAQWMSRDILRARHNTLVIPVPPFRYDQAAKIVLAP